MYLSDGTCFREHYEQQIRELNAEVSINQDNLSVGALVGMLRKLDESERNVSDSIELDIPTKSILKANMLKVKAYIFIALSIKNIKKTNFSHVSFEEEIKTPFSEKEIITLNAYMKDGKYIPSKINCEYGGKNYSIAMDSEQLKVLNNPTIPDYYNSIFWLLQRQKLTNGKSSILYAKLRSGKNGSLHSILEGIEGFDFDDFVLGGKGVELHFENIQGANKLSSIKTVDNNLREIVNVKFLNSNNFCRLKLGENYSSPTYSFRDGKLIFISNGGKMARPNSISRLTGDIMKHYTKRVHGISLTGYGSL